MRSVRISRDSRENADVTPAGRSLLVVVLALAAGGAAYFAVRAGMAPDGPAAPATSTPAASPSLVAAPARPQAVIPAMRPDVTLADREGKPRSLSEWDGRPQVINFWATWCAPCRREIPMLNALAKDRASDVALIGIAIDFREEVLRYMDATPIEYPVLIGEQDGLDAARAFGMESLGLPFTAFVDRQGRIVTIHVGELHRPQADVILSIVREVDAGKLDLPSAQARIKTAVPQIG
jgi:thiol-disulfide isomerase/thioredoxin